MFLWKFIKKILSGKIDVGQYPDVGMKFHINTSALTRQLPTLILFENGKESGRVPTIISGSSSSRKTTSSTSLVSTTCLTSARKTKSLLLKPKNMKCWKKRKNKNKLKCSINCCVIQLCKIDLQNISPNYVIIWISLNSPGSIYFPNQHSYKLIF